MCVLMITLLSRLVGRLGSHKPFNTHKLVKSVHNRCYRSFWWRFCVLTLLFGFFFSGCRGFCHRTELDLFLFPSSCIWFFYSYLRFVQYLIWPGIGVGVGLVVCSTIPLDILTIFSPSITLNLRNIFLIYIQLNFSWMKKILQTKKLLS